MRLISGILTLFLMVTVNQVKAGDVRDELARLKEQQDYKTFYATAFLGMLDTPEQVELMDESAQGLMYLGMLERSLAVTQQVLTRDPGREAAKLRKEDIAARLEHVHKRMNELEIQTETQANKTEPFAQLAAIHIGLGNYGPALNYVNQAKRIDGKNLMVRLMDTAFQNRLDLPTKEAIAMSQVALERFEEGKRAEAYTLFRKSLSLSVISPFVYDNLATMLIQERRALAASMVLEEIMHIRPEAAVLLEAANLAYGAGDFNRAVKLYDQCLNQYGDDPVAHYNMGLCLVRLGDPDSGKTHMARALELNPELKPDPSGMVRVRGMAFKP